MTPNNISMTNNNGNQPTNNYFMSFDFDNNVSDNTVNTILAMKRLREGQDEDHKEKRREIDPCEESSTSGVPETVITTSREVIMPNSQPSIPNSQPDMPSFQPVTSPNINQRSNNCVSKEVTQNISKAPLNVVQPANNTVYRTKTSTVVTQLRKQRCFVCLMMKS